MNKLLIGNKYLLVTVQICVQKSEEFIGTCHHQTVRYQEICPLCRKIGHAVFLDLDIFCLFKHTLFIVINHTEGVIVNPECRLRPKSHKRFRSTHHGRLFHIIINKFCKIMDLGGKHRKAMTELVFIMNIHGQSISSEKSCGCVNIFTGVFNLNIQDNHSKRRCKSYE